MVLYVTTYYYLLENSDVSQFIFFFLCGAFAFPPLPVITTHFEYK